jgi:hypothetical protein
MDNTSWFRICGALKYLTAHGWPVEVCYRLWNEWSATAGDAVNAAGKPIYVPSEMKTVWNTAGGGPNPPTHLSLFGAARDAGWWGWVMGNPIPNPLSAIITEYFPDGGPGPGRAETADDVDDKHATPEELGNDGDVTSAALAAATATTKDLVEETIKTGGKAPRTREMLGHLVVLKREANDLYWALRTQLAELRVELENGKKGKFLCTGYALDNIVKEEATRLAKEAKRAKKGTKPDAAASPGSKPRLHIKEHRLDQTVAALRDILSESGILYRAVPVKLVWDQALAGYTVHQITADDLVLIAHQVCSPYVIKQDAEGNFYETLARFPRTMASAGAAYAEAGGCCPF